MSFPTAVGPTDIQGNILKGHGRKHSCLVFFRFGADRDKSRRLVHDAAKQAEDVGITSADIQQKQANHLRSLLAMPGLVSPAKLAEAKGQPFRSLALSAAGLKALGHDRRSLQVTDPLLVTEPFWDGTARYGPAALGDTGPWSASFEPEPHGVFLVAHEDRDACRSLAKKCRKAIEDPARYGGGVTGTEEGFKWTPHNDGIGYEPFGFADGFARTQFTAKKKSPLRHLIEGTDLGNVSNRTRPYELPLEQVMIQTAGSFLGASFLVVRKIEQNVRAFYEAEAELEKKLALQRGRLPHLPRDAGALFVGRERDGTPLTYRGAGNPLAHRFHFGADKTGSRCPFHAHIRKMNPRQIFPRISDHSMNQRENQKLAQFVRRGMVYGDEMALRASWRDNPAAAPTGGCGLLFMGYMNAVGGQFLQMLQSWAGSEEFPKIPSGSDPLVRPAGKWTWPQHEGLEIPTPQAFVTGRGAGYFVVFTLPVLREL